MNWSISRFGAPAAVALGVALAWGASMPMEVTASETARGGVECTCRSLSIINIRCSPAAAGVQCEKFVPRCRVNKGTKDGLCFNHPTQNCKPATSTCAETNATRCLFRDDCNENEISGP